MNVVFAYVPHSRGAASSASNPSGMMVVYLIGDTTYCWNVPGTFFPWVSLPNVGKSHAILGEQ